MQFLEIDKTTTLSQLSATVGSRNVDTVLAANQLSRTPDIGSKFLQKCKEIYEAGEAYLVDRYRKVNILNTLTGDSEAYERACLMDENEWKVFGALNTFMSTLRIPSSLSLPPSANIIGSNQSVSSSVYRKTMNDLQNTGRINPAVFSDYAAGPLGSAVDSYGTVVPQNDMFNAFKIPWGEVQLYSSLADETVDFPCYPEEVETTRVANYATMDGTLYQYEPWYTYESSGPREQSLTFAFHRDMWSGDHRDDKANQLIRFCDACCYPDYDGSAVNTSTVTLYIHGTAFITGILTQVTTHWTGPISSYDGWYLQCELTLTILEVASSPLSFSTVRGMNVIGGYGK